MRGPAAGAVVIDGARLRPYALPLAAPWCSARGELTRRRGWLVLLEGDGYRGVGDCAPLPAAGTETPERARTWLTRALPALVGQDVSRLLAALPAAPPAARFAVETALLDLRARALGRPLWRLLAEDAPPEVRCNAVAGALDETAGERVAAALAAGFSCIKLKVGVAGVAVESARLRSVAARLPAGATLRLDANGAWDERRARAFLQGLDGLPVESLEEPLADADGAALARLQAAAPCDLALDESLAHRDPAVVVAAAPVRRLVLKPAVLGGLERALDLGRRARAHGIASVVTTTLESTVGTRAAVHLAFALGATDLAHGLATAAWLREDVAEAPPLQGDRIARPSDAGLGVTLARGSM